MTTLPRSLLFYGLLSLLVCLASSRPVFAQSTRSLKEAVRDRFKIGVGVSDNIPLRHQDWALLVEHF